MSQVLQVGSNFWMPWNTSLSNDVKSHVEASTLIYVYAGLALGSCVLVFVRAIAIGTAGYKMTTILFKKMHLCIFRAPMSFFDSTPSGRILNRVSKDQSEVDYDILAIMGGFATNTIRLIAVIVVMAMGAWQVCIIYVPVVVACIWYQALDKCQLGVEVRKKEEKLDSTVTENGENWSMGQRQLVYLGRVLLKRSKILVLDEATASVDTATDNIIQKTLRQHVPEATVVTIAHRVTSVLDSDVILVLDNVHVVEYDSPNKLLENKNSSFAKLVAEQVQVSYT